MCNNLAGAGQLRWEIIRFVKFLLQGTIVRTTPYTKNFLSSEENNWQKGLTKLRKVGMTRSRNPEKIGKKLLMKQEPCEQKAT